MIDKDDKPQEDILDEGLLEPVEIESNSSTGSISDATEPLDPRFFYEPGSSNSSKLAHIKTDDAHIERDKTAGTQTARVEEFYVIWPLHDEQTGEAIDVSDLTEARLVLDIIAKKSLASRSLEVTLGVSEYQECRGQRTTNSAKTRVKLESIRRIWQNGKLRYWRYVKDPGSGKSELREFECPILRESTPIGKKSRSLVVVLDDKFAADILHIGINKAPMLFLTGLFKIDTKYHPDAYYIGRKIIEQKNNSKGNINEDRLTVKILLDEVRSRKSYSELIAERAKRKNRINIRSKVREPFEADLNHFCDATGLEYEFHYPNNGPAVPDDVLESCPFEDYAGFVLWFSWPSLPPRFVDYRQRKIDNRKLQLEQSEIRQEAERQVAIDDEKKKIKAARTKAKKKASNK